MDDETENAGLKRLAPAFTSLVRNRGLQYVEAGRVSLVERTADVLAAKVTGSGESYQVVYIRHGSGGHYACTCPHFERETRGCKHLWAAALEGAGTAMVCNTIPLSRRLVADPNLAW